MGPPLPAGNRARTTLGIPKATPTTREAPTWIDSTWASWAAARLAQSAYPTRPAANTFGDGEVERIGRLIPGIEANHWWSLTVDDAERVMEDARRALLTTASLATLGGEVLDDSTFGRTDLGVDDALRLGLLVGQWKDDHPTEGLAMDFRPRSHHGAVLEQARRSAHGAGELELAAPSADVLHVVGRRHLPGHRRELVRWSPGGGAGPAGDDESATSERAWVRTVG